MKQALALTLCILCLSSTATAYYRPEGNETTHQAERRAKRAEFANALLRELEKRQFRPSASETSHMEERRLKRAAYWQNLQLDVQKRNQRAPRTQTSHAQERARREQSA